MNSLTSIGGDFELGTSHPYGYPMVGGNPALNSLTGLENLSSIGGHFEIINCDSLTSFTGLEDLTSIGGNLGIGAGSYNSWGFINGNSSLVKLTGLEGLTSINGKLLIGGNEVLISLTALENLNAGSISDLSITNNPSLSVCAVQSICAYLSSPNGVVDISNNAPGCNSAEEVMDSCGITSVENLIPESSLNIYPNPSSTSITIETSVPGQLSILNQNGQQLITRQVNEAKTEIGISTLPSGVYVVKVVGEKGVQVGKFIKE